MRNTHIQTIPASEYNQCQTTSSLQSEFQITSQKRQPEDVNSRDGLLFLRAFSGVSFLFFPLIYFSSHLFIYLCCIIQRTAQTYDIPIEITGCDKKKQRSRRAT